TCPSLHSFYLPILLQPISTLFPYTTLFRSKCIIIVFFCFTENFWIRLEMDACTGNIRITDDFQVCCWNPAFKFLVMDFAITMDKIGRSTRLNSSHVKISYAVFCLKKKKLND